MRTKTEITRYMADFETTTTPDPTTGRVEVWAAAICPIAEPAAMFGKAKVMDDIPSFIFHILDLAPCEVYFHNLKFDGMFILDYLLHHGYPAALEGNDQGEPRWMKNKQMPPCSYKCLISEASQFYHITIKNRFGEIVTIRDSLKLLPFSVADIGRSFKTMRQKTEIDYTAHDLPGTPISDQEREYIENDVYVVAEALHMLFSDGYTKSTIGSNCLEKYKSLCPENFDEIFPNPYELEIEGLNVGEFCRAGYGGGWCYVNPHKRNRIVRNGITLDVNSLYPYIMHSKSGIEYPVGEPYKVTQEIENDKFYFVHFKAAFRIKRGKLPFVHIRGSAYYSPQECLTSSDIAGKKYYEGELIAPEMTMCKYEYELFLKHYKIEHMEIINVMYFYTMTGMFDDYINLFYEEKKVAKGAKRSEAKLFLNNLYGKLAVTPDSDFKIPYLNEDGILCFDLVEANDKTPGYIPCGATITAAAKCYTICAAQANYHGAKPGFCYGDTDSIHCDMLLSAVLGMTLGEVELGEWKCESEWKEAIFVRAKCYIEITRQNIDNVLRLVPDIKCAGLPARCKDLLSISMGYTEITKDKEERIKSKMGEECLEFAKTPRKITDYKVGLLIPGKLRPEIIAGGVILGNTTFLIKKH